MNDFKVGDTVKIVADTSGKFSHMVGKIGVIRKVAIYELGVVSYFLENIAGVWFGDELENE